MRGSAVESSSNLATFKNDSNITKSLPLHKEWVLASNKVLQNEQPSSFVVSSALLCILKIPFQLQIQFGKLLTQYCQPEITAAKTKFIYERNKLLQMRPQTRCLYKCNEGSETWKAQPSRSLALSSPGGNLYFTDFTSPPF